MPSRGREARSYLFTDRIWPEEVGDGRIEWRGKVLRVMSGETLYFHDWPTILAFIQQALEQRATPTEATEATEVSELTDQSE